jgi:hypothetical protein
MNARQKKNVELSLFYYFFLQVRVPFSSFRPVNPQDPPLDPFLVHTLTIRFEPKRQVSAMFCINFQCYHMTVNAALAMTSKGWLSN